MSSTAPQWVWSREHNNYYYQQFENGEWQTQWAKSSPQATHAQHVVPQLVHAHLQTGGNQSFVETSHYDSIQHRIVPRNHSEIQVHGETQSATVSQIPKPSQALEQTPLDEEKARVSSYIYPQPYAGGSAYSNGGNTGGKGIAGSNAPIPPPYERVAFLSAALRLGSDEHSDPSYWRRTEDFFCVGRVFAIISTDSNDERNAIHGRVRRFVIVNHTRSGYCHVCPIYTYGGRGTTNPGCRPDHHAIAYLVGTVPDQLYGEFISRHPISIRPADPPITLDRASRINFGEVFLVQTNVKVKDIGMVTENSLAILNRNWFQVQTEEEEKVHDDDEDDKDENENFVW